MQQCACSLKHLTGPGHAKSGSRLVKLKAACRPQGRPEAGVTAQPPSAQTVQAADMASLDQAMPKQKLYVNGNLMLAGGCRGDTELGKLRNRMVRRLSKQLKWHPSIQTRSELNMT